NVETSWCSWAEVRTSTVTWYCRPGLRAAADFHERPVPSIRPLTVPPLVSVNVTPSRGSRVVTVTTVDGMTLVVPFAGLIVIVGTNGAAAARALGCNSGFASDANTRPSGPSTHRAPASTHRSTTSVQ